MPSPSSIVKTRLQGSTYARFRAEQAARGLSESDLLRLALHRLFDDTDRTPSLLTTTPDQTSALVAPNPEQTSLERKTVWMPAFLMSAASDRAKAKKMSFSRWICSLVQSNVMREPVLTALELQTLEAATRELAAAGRYLNQMTRVLDEAYFETERIRLDKLTELSATISETREAFNALVRASRHSWRTD